jgi:hypothetical protein
VEDHVLEIVGLDSGSGLVMGDLLEKDGLEIPLVEMVTVFERVSASHVFAEFWPAPVLGRKQSAQSYRTGIVSDSSTLLKSLNVGTAGTTCRNTRPVEG